MTALKLAGAEPKTVTPAEYYTAMQTGVIDGVILALYSLEQYSLQELVTSVTLVPLAAGGFASLGFMINKDLWDSFPEDLKDTTLDVVVASESYRDEYSMRALTEGKLMLAKYGIEAIELSDEELKRWYEVVGIPSWEAIGKKIGDPWGPQWVALAKKAAGF